MEIRIVRDAVSRNVLREIAKQQFGDMVKAVVDVEQGIMAIGGELHSDEEALLLDQGSLQRHLWASTSTLSNRLRNGMSSIQ
jgi:hypothetical protein